MSDETKDASGLTVEECEILESYLRRGCEFQAALIRKARIMGLDRGRAPSSRDLEMMYDYLTYVRGTLEGAIAFAASRGERGLREQVDHPMLKGSG